MPYVEFEGTMRELPPGETLVGSGSQAAWRLQHVDLAARHFTLTVHDEHGTQIRPYSAQTIVVVNGRQVSLEALPLRHGDIVRAGAARFVFHEWIEQARPSTSSKRSSGSIAAGTAHLVNELESRAHPLAERMVSIGRDAASHVLVRDPSVSRFHADVRSEAGQYVLYSMGSAGTRINGHLVSAPQVLEEGDVIEVGNVALKFTQEPLPPGLSISIGGHMPADDTTRRATVVQRAVDLESIPETRKSRMPLVLGILALIVVIAIALYVRR